MMKKCCLLFFLVHLTLLHSVKVFHDVENYLNRKELKSRDLCPASKLLSTETRRSHYPIDLFHERADDVYSCYFELIKLNGISHNCSHSQFHCPLHDEFLPQAMKTFEKASTQVCNSFDALKKNAKVNMIILGGSVTNGGYARGCYEGECQERMTSDNRYCGNSPGDCTWHRGVHTYLTRNFKNENIHRINLAIGATSSCTAQNFLFQRLKELNITLSSSDIIFLDYSANDGVVFDTPKMIQKLKTCLQLMMAKIYFLSGKNWPTIFFLEYWPFHGTNFHNVQPNEITYSEVYHEIAQIYHIPIISYRDLHWSEIFQEKMKKFPGLDEIIRFHWAENQNNFDIHPPWVVHDFYADLISAVLNETEKLCARDKNGFVELEIPKPSVNDLPRHSCDTDNCIPVLNLVASSSSPYLNDEDVQNLKYGWHLYQDRLGKPGWIIQNIGNYQKNTKTKKNPYSFLSVDIPMIAEIKKSSMEGVLSITFMKTYFNAGGFQVYLCGNLLPAPWRERLVQIDTLTESHYTTSEVATYVFKINQFCGDLNGIASLSIEHLSLQDHPEVRKYQKVKISSVQFYLHR